MNQTEKRRLWKAKYRQWKIKHAAYRAQILQAVHLASVAAAEAHKPTMQ